MDACLTHTTEQRPYVSPRSFESQLELGRKFERALADWLMRRGWRILPVYDYSGLGENKAPKFAALHSTDSLVTPDLLAARGGELKWCEVKYKTRCDWTRITQRYETGISLRLFRQYQLIEKETGVDVWLIFVHREQNEVLGQRLKVLSEAQPPNAPRIYTGSKMGRGGMVFFPCCALRRLCECSDLRCEVSA